MKFGTLVAILKPKPTNDGVEHDSAVLTLRNAARYPGRIDMTVSNWTETDSNRAQQIWSEYAYCHDLGEKAGQTAGIDPATGRIWFGRSIQDVIAQRDAAASNAPLYFVRVGSATYYRKGGHR